jgi:hypothetical protein
VRRGPWSPSHHVVVIHIQERGDRCVCEMGGGGGEGGETWELSFRFFFPFLFSFSFLFFSLLHCASRFNKSLYRKWTFIKSRCTAVFFYQIEMTAVFFFSKKTAVHLDLIKVHFLYRLLLNRDAQCNKEKRKKKKKRQKETK